MARRGMRKLVEAMGLREASERSFYVVSAPADGWGCSEDVRFVLDAIFKGGWDVVGRDRGETLHDARKLGIVALSSPNMDAAKKHGVGVIATTWAAALRLGRLGEQRLQARVVPLLEKLRRRDVLPAAPEGRLVAFGRHGRLQPLRFPAFDVSCDQTHRRYLMKYHPA